MSTTKEVLTDTVKSVIDAIHNHQYHTHPENNIDDTWITTRQVSEWCDISIYKARYVLLQLEEKGLVTRQTHGEKTSLWWRPTQIFLG